MIKKEERLSGFNLRRVCRKGIARRGRFLILKSLVNFKNKNRFGFIISSKIVKKASDRNLIRRRLSEIARPYIDLPKPYRDIVLILRKEADFSKLKQEVESLING